jgi:cyclophilin family peptidyl-prolyl cis-trans isomerase
MKVTLTTSKGPITIELDSENAPISTENFLAYADAGEYDGTIFHRVIDGFMIQGGAFTPDMKQREGSRGGIKNEWQNGLSNTRGTVAMARLGNQPDSATNQFFINVSDNDFLDQPRDGAGYAVFGKVTEGLDVIDEIRGVPTTNKAGHGDVPVEPIMIESVKRAD